jgi:hypothetical protein
MAETKLRIINRYDHINNWERINPTLAIGEIVVVLFQDRSVKLKVGDGGLFNNTSYVTDSLIDNLNDELLDIKERLDELEAPIDSLLIGTKLLEDNEIFNSLTIKLSEKFTLLVGQQNVFYAKAIEPISKGDAVQFAGSEGNHSLIKKAVQNEINSNSEYFIGLAAHDFNNNEFGFVLEFGPLTGIKVGDFVNGDILWYDSSGIVSGKLTKVKPPRGNAQIRIAAVINDQNSTNGQWLIRPDRLEGNTNNNNLFVSEEEPTEIKINNDIWFDL